MALYVSICILGHMEVCLYACVCVPAEALGLSGPAPRLTHAPGCQQVAPEHRVLGSGEGGQLCSSSPLLPEGISAVKTARVLLTLLVPLGFILRLCLLWVPPSAHSETEVHPVAKRDTGHKEGSDCGKV